MRKIFSLFAAILFAATMTVDAKTIYCKAPAWWAAGTATGVYAWNDEGHIGDWPGVRMTAVEGEENTWSIDLDDQFQMLVFTRMNPSDVGDLYWGAKTEDLTIPADKDLFTITSATETWDPAKVQGEWSVYGEEPQPQLPTVAIAGVMNEWNDKANVMEAAEDGLTASCKMTLNAEDVEFKVVVDGHWLAKDAVYDITRENSVVEGVDQEIAYGPNLNLKADVAGEYTFVWTYASHALAVTFPGEEPPVVDEPKFYITGTANLVGAENEWHPDALPVKEESAVLSLEPGAYMMKVTLKGNWEEGVLGFDQLTGEKPAGVTRGADGDDNNICFTLDEAGDVTVTYTGEIFTIAGKFHTDEPIVEPKFYITGTANLVGAENEWHPDALPVKEESAVLSLEPGAYMMKVTLKGNWNEGVLGFDELTGEKPAGVTRGADGDDNNICFALDEAGDVTVTYTGEIFTIAGKFHTDEPVVDEPKFYIASESLVGSWAPNALPVKADSYTFENLTAGTAYSFKVTVDGTWETAKGFADLTVKPAGVSGDGDGNVCFKLAEDGNVVITYTAEVFTVEGNFEGGDVPPVVEDGFYLVGNITEWQVVADAAHKFALTEVEGELKLHFTLAEGNAIKVVGVHDGNQTWYPDGEGNEYIVDADHAGECDIYFRPEYHADWAEFGGHIYIASSGQGIEETLAEGKVVKVIREGQILIMKGNNCYTLMGQIAK